MADVVLGVAIGIVLSLIAFNFVIRNRYIMLHFFVAMRRYIDSQMEKKRWPPHVFRCPVCDSCWSCIKRGSEQ